MQFLFDERLQSHSICIFHILIESSIVRCHKCFCRFFLEFLLKWLLEGFALVKCSHHCHEPQFIIIYRPTYISAIQPEIYKQHIRRLF